jgi:hypothetical protein
MKSSTMARQIRSMYPLFFASPVFCIGMSIYFASQHYYLYAASFLVMAGGLLPPMWIMYKRNRKICEEAIIQYEEYVASPAGKNTLVRPSSIDKTIRNNEMLRPAEERHEDERETLLRQERE